MFGACGVSLYDYYSGMIRSTISSSIDVISNISIPTELNLNNFNLNPNKPSNTDDIDTSIMSPVQADNSIIDRLVPDNNTTIHINDHSTTNAANNNFEDYNENENYENDVFNDTTSNLNYATMNDDVNASVLEATFDHMDL